MPTPVPPPSPRNFPGEPEPSLTTPNLTGFDSLPRFLEEVRGYFDDIVYYWNPILFKETFRETIKNAWNDARQFIQQGILRLSDPNFPPGSLESLWSAGLEQGGNELQLKLALLKDAWARFHERGLVTNLKDVLEGISVILESMAKALPVLERVKEFTEAILYAINLTESGI